MTVRYKNDGAYPDYALDGSSLSFRGGELRLELAALQRDYPVRVTVSEDATGRLTTGTAHRYVAEVDIPARTSTVEKTGIADDYGFPVLRRIYAPFTHDGVLLTLWAQKGGR